VANQKVVRNVLIVRTASQRISQRDQRVKVVPKGRSVGSLKNLKA